MRYAHKIAAALCCALIFLAPGAPARGLYLAPDRDEPQRGQQNTAPPTLYRAPQGQGQARGPIFYGDVPRAEPPRTRVFTNYAPQRPAPDPKDEAMARRAALMERAAAQATERRARTQALLAERRARAEQERAAQDAPRPTPVSGQTPMQAHVQPRIVYAPPERTTTPPGIFEGAR
jgi:hypothetical protein